MERAGDAEHASVAALEVVEIGDGAQVGCATPAALHCDARAWTAHAATYRGRDVRHHRIDMEHREQHALRCRARCVGDLRQRQALLRIPGGGPRLSLNVTRVRSTGAAFPREAAPVRPDRRGFVASSGAGNAT